MNESDNVIPIGRRHERPDDDERIDPGELDDSEFISAILSRITHPTMAKSDAHQIAVFIMSEFMGNEATLDTWQVRFRELSVDVMSLSDDQFGTVIAPDQMASALITLIRSKNHHTAGNEDILAAARVLIDLRTGYLTKLDRNKRDDPRRWSDVIDKLSKTT